MKNDKDLKSAEADGKVRSLPEMKETKVTTKVGEDIIDTPDEFRTAIGRCQMDQIDHIEVTDRLFDYLVKGHPTPYLCYGAPGVKVYRVGTKDGIDREERMSAEQHSDYMAKKRNVLI